MATQVATKTGVAALACPVQLVATCCFGEQSWPSPEKRSSRKVWGRADAQGGARHGVVELLGTRARALQRPARLKDSREQLLAAIESFRFAQGFESFFTDVERQAADLNGPAREQMLEKVRRARALLGGVDALERFSRWVPPEDSRDSATGED